jgi:hypothetical protein
LLSGMTSPELWPFLRISFTYINIYVQNPKAPDSSFLHTLQQKTLFRNRKIACRSAKKLSADPGVIPAPLLNLVAAKACGACGRFRWGAGLNLESGGPVSARKLMQNLTPNVRGLRSPTEP